MVRHYNNNLYTQSKPSYTNEDLQMIKLHGWFDKLEETVLNKHTCKLPFNKDNKKCKEIEMKEKIKDLVDGNKDTLDIKLPDVSDSTFFSPMINKNNSLLKKISQTVKDIKNDLNELEEGLLFTDFFVDCSVREEFLDNVEII